MQRFIFPHIYAFLQLCTEPNISGTQHFLVSQRCPYLAFTLHVIVVLLKPVLKREDLTFSTIQSPFKKKHTHTQNTQHSARKIIPYRSRIVCRLLWLPSHAIVAAMTHCHVNIEANRECILSLLGKDNILCPTRLMFHACITRKNRKSSQPFSCFHKFLSYSKEKRTQSKSKTYLNHLNLPKTLIAPCLFAAESKVAWNHQINLQSAVFLSISLFCSFTSRPPTPFLVVRQTQQASSDQ